MGTMCLNCPGVHDTLSRASSLYCTYMYCTKSLQWILKLTRSPKFCIYFVFVYVTYTISHKIFIIYERGFMEIEEIVLLRYSWYFRANATLLAQAECSKMSDPHFKTKFS